MSPASKGRTAEYVIRDFLVRLNYSVLRSAASKGSADLVAFNAWEVLVVAVRKERWPPPAVRHRLHKLERNPVVFALVARTVRGKPQFALDFDGVLTPVQSPLPLHRHPVSKIPSTRPHRVS